VTLARMAPSPSLSAIATTSESRGRVWHACFTTRAGQNKKINKSPHTRGRVPGGEGCFVFFATARACPIKARQALPTGCVCTTATRDKFYVDCPPACKKQAPADRVDTEATSLLSPNSLGGIFSDSHTGHYWQVGCRHPCILLNPCIPREDFAEIRRGMRAASICVCIL